MEWVQKLFVKLNKLYYKIYVTFDPEQYAR